jgi:hypothetical protein
MQSLQDREDLARVVLDLADRIAAEASKARARGAG